MYEQISQQFINFSRNVADGMLKAQQIAAESFTKSVEIQFGLAEERSKVNADFAKELSEVRDLDAAKKVWPKGTELARENVEKAYGVSRELFELSLKTGEAFGELMQSGLETVKAEAQKTQAKTAKASAK